MRLQRVEPQPKGGYRYPVVAEATADAQGPLGAEEGAGGLASRGRRGGRLRARGSPAMPGSTSSRAGPPTIAAWPAPPPSRAGSPTTRAGRWRTSRCGSQDVQPDVRRPLRVAARLLLQDRRRRPLPGGSGSRRPRHDLGPQARLLPPGPGPADHDAEGRRRAEHDQVRRRPRHGRFRREGAARRLHRADRARGRGGRREVRGSGNIDAKNQIAFENVPPGRYVLRGQPNPVFRRSARPGRSRST